MAIQSLLRNYAITQSNLLDNKQVYLIIKVGRVLTNRQRCAKVCYKDNKGKACTELSRSGGKGNAILHQN